MKNYKIERNINKRINYINSLKHEVKYTFKKGIELKQTHSQILERVAERVYKTDKYKKIGNVGRATISGYVDANFDNMYNFVEWVCWYDGCFMGLTKKFKYPDNYNHELMVCSYVYKGTETCY